MLCNCRRTNKNGGKEMIIEVEWTGIASGLTQIDISELGCMSRREWDALSRDEQKNRINEWQESNEVREFKQLDWYEYED
jgi:hypothetical protein